jgi:hypothetical protein
MARFASNDLIFWSAIQWGCEHGFTSLDLGRTDLENHGLREFKSRWGAEEVPLSYSYYPSGPGGGESRLLPLLKEIMRRSPPIVCRLAGELFYQYFG